MQSQASRKYRQSEKGKLQTKKEEAKNGRKRALRYSRSEKGITNYLKRVFNVDYKDWCTVNKIIQGRCTICRKVNENKKRLSVDHDHKTNKFRGLLCNPCNKGLGHFKDDPLLLKKAISYLETNKSNNQITIPIFD